MPRKTFKIVIFIMLLALILTTFSSAFAMIFS
ncbi:hypothetical protein JOD45_002359 [Scopulibacillus daqui]|uniref:DUF4044 domain-containing protein n=1 Tax=Scopulibacillus daqui TaxID=1469162 RepID=A0ABS2Q1P5_9BACL|nr:stressosome-associated protein Prli42 [Scopulibacillus daqui]MBM7646133.1 hypothetical protein [Scopulibacillus daqui]